MQRFNGSRSTTATEVSNPDILQRAARGAMLGPCTRGLERPIRTPTAEGEYEQ